jgi:signal transduction histidine kinase
MRREAAQQATVRLLVLVLLVALAPACAVMAILGGGHAVLVTAEILVPVGLLALALAELAQRGLVPLPTLRRRFELGVLLALGQLLAAVAIGAAVMFVSAHDAWMTIAILLFAAVVATRAAQLLLAGVTSDIQAVRDGLHALERGERALSIEARSSRELEDLAATANRLVAALSAEERARDGADVARRQVIAAVSHDLRTPLSTLRLLAQALEDDLVDEATSRRYVHTIGVNVRTLGSLIDDLFELSCLDAGEITWSTAAVNLHDLVNETMELVRPSTEASHVALSAELPDDLAPAHANADQLRRVLLNLLQNAIHHTPADGSVAIRAAHADDATIEVEVSDTGEGITAEDRAHVFEPFYRGRSDATRTRPGSGLGLAISRAIVQAHGGRIWLADSQSGTQIHFTLPLEASAPPQPALEASAPPQPPLSASQHVP